MEKGTPQTAFDLPSTIALLQHMFPDFSETRCLRCVEVLRTVFVYSGDHDEPWWLAA